MTTTPATKAPAKRTKPRLRLRHKWAFRNPNEFGGRKLRVFDADAPRGWIFLRPFEMDSGRLFWVEDWDRVDDATIGRNDVLTYRRPNGSGIVTRYLGPIPAAETARRATAALLKELRERGRTS